MALEIAESRDPLYAGAQVRAGEPMEGRPQGPIDPGEPDLGATVVKLRVARGLPLLVPSPLELEKRGRFYERRRVTQDVVWREGSTGFGQGVRSFVSGCANVSFDPV